MSRYAVISDIHGNLHAFLAVLNRLSEFEVDDVICLGDIVGYGPEPGQCVDLVANYAGIAVRGNHDDAVVDPRLADGFNGAAREAIHWTVNAVGPLHLRALNALPAVRYLDHRGAERVMCIHDCPVPLPTDYVHDKYIAAMAFRGVQSQICLLGHTHVPMVFEAPTDNVEDQLTAPEINAYIMTDGCEIVLEPGRRYICNPGSVGQPRDSDPRASFAILDLDRNTFTVHREEYDIAAAQHATQEAGLPTILAERLAIGA